MVTKHNITHNKNSPNVPVSSFKPIINYFHFNEVNKQWFDWLKLVLLRRLSHGRYVDKALIVVHVIFFMRVASIEVTSIKSIP